MNQDIKSLLEFWFSSSTPGEMNTHRKEWWVKDPEFDRRIQDEFSPLFEKADAGELDDWKETPLGCVALALLLDQFPRNMFRGKARAFASDEKARALTRHVLDKGFDKNLPIGARLFLYLPLEHSEDLQDQNDCIKLVESMGDEGYLDFAKKHQVIIKRFGRFPHRNETLGRTSTNEEVAFLSEPGSSF
ncbi:DUF924 family protein [Terasakiella sp. A23]|uniref:DUF924 family protein n=1 Tax=Terasakiella sp. FCG-A23 TaxID=3080561 RepID=UPI002953C3BA|nr:DUF924 family protein [Terasakiella sp. A23]MDV7339690.1 DUF924 family protein [Terasakiella sp. A23]